MRVYGLGFGLGLDITNSKKSKNGKLSQGILLCDLPPEKIINMSYGGFYKKTFTEMSYEIPRCMVFD